MSAKSEIKRIVESQPVVFFSKTECVFCDKLEEDLKGMQIPYHKAMLEPALRDTLIGMTNCKTVPQLFIGGTFVGGYREFSTLCGSGRIMGMLEPHGIVPVIDF